MPKQVVANPLYSPGFNDPTFGKIAQNGFNYFAALQSPNDRADAEAKAALMGAQEFAARASGGKDTMETRILGYKAEDLGDPVGASGKTIADHLNITDPNQRAIYDTLRQSRINSVNPKNIAEGEKYNMDVATMLNAPAQEPTVSRQNAALKGEALVDNTDFGLFDKFNPNIPQVPSPLGTAKVLSEKAQARNYDASAAEARAKAANPDFGRPKPQKDYMYDANGDLVVRPNTQTDLKMKKTKATDATNLQTLNTNVDDQIRSINQLIGSEDGTVKPHPGLNGFVGAWDALKPKLFGDSANAAAIHNKLKSQASIKGLQDIRSQGGAVGSITEREWPILQQMHAAITNEQDEKQYTEELANYRNELLNFKITAARQFQDTYTNGTPAALPTDVTEDDIQQTMRENNWTREQVMQRLKSGG